MKPFKLRVDWTVAKAYPGEPVVVELHVMDEAPKVIHASRDGEAVAWAVKWLQDRGFEFTCLIDDHQRRDDTHITLHPRPS